MNTHSDSQQHWYVLLGGKRHGPFSYAELTRAVREGLISAETNIWRSGWKNWHLAKSVKGLMSGRTPAPAAPPPTIPSPVMPSVVERPAMYDVRERPANEAPLAPDDVGWGADERVRAPAAETHSYAPQQRRETRRPQEVVTLRWDRGQPPAEDKSDHIFAEEWRMLAERPPDRPAEERRASVPARIVRKAPPARAQDLQIVSGYSTYDDIDYRPAYRGARRNSSLGGFGTFLKRAVIGLGAVLVVAGGGVVLLQSGVLRLKSSGGAHASLVTGPGDLPPAVAALPAVVTLQRNDPAAFERFRRRYADSAANARNDEVLTLARNALRKSVKQLLAISSGDVVLEITETSLAYLQGLQAANPESCVALSDESKGARLTSNLARDLPSLFNREMAALDKVAGTNPHIAVAPMSTQDAAPYFDRLNRELVRQQVNTDLLRDPQRRLNPSEFAPYCALVIAFYRAVLDLPRDDKINLLRYLYASAAVNADNDLNR